MLRYLLFLTVLLCGCVRPDSVAPTPQPEPVPQVDPAADSKLRVLILFEHDELANYPTEQMLAIQGPEVRNWLTSHSADWRIWDQHVDTSLADPFWRDAVKMPRESLPWIWISGAGKKGVSGPLPKSAAEVVELLGRYAK